MLTILIPSKATDIKNASNAICLYLLSIYYVEKHRRAHNVDYVLQYLIDDRNTESLDLLESIADEILKIHLFDKQQSATSIQENCRSLLVNSTHYRIRVRKFCFRKIDQVLDEYPQMLWNKTLVHLMIDLLRFLDCDDFNIRQKYSDG